MWLMLSFFCLFAFSSCLDAAGADFDFFAGNGFGMQIDALSGFGLDVGVGDIVGASHASPADGTCFGHKINQLRITN